MGKKMDMQFASHSKTLLEALSTLQVGESKSYKDLSKLIDLSVQSTQGRGYLNTARYVLQREQHMVFDVIRNEGIVRLDDEQIIDTVDKTHTKIRKAARNQVKKTICADYDSLTNDKKLKHNVTISIMGAIAEMNTNGGIKKVTAKTADMQMMLSKAAAAAVALQNVG
jgi:hypothetical protein